MKKENHHQTLSDYTFLKIKYKSQSESASQIVNLKLASY